MTKLLFAILWGGRPRVSNHKNQQSPCARASLSLAAGFIYCYGVVSLLACARAVRKMPTKSIERPLLSELWKWPSALT
jgi:hypothetical protein